LDGELDATRSAEFERHLEAAANAPTSLGSEESLRSSLQRSGLYENAPLGLRKKIRADLDAATPLMQPFDSRLALARRGRHHPVGLRPCLGLPGRAGA